MMKSNLDALEWCFTCLSKTDRTKLAAIKTEENLTSFLKKFDLSPNCYIKAIIPTLYKLQNFINSINDETNISEIIRNSSDGTSIKRLMNVPNYSQTMKNFYSAEFFITFRLGTDICIAIRENENWNSPKIDIPINESVIYNEVPFISLKQELNRYTIQYIKENFIKDETSEGQLTQDIIDQYKYRVDFSKFKWQPTYEQAVSLFEKFYRFNPCQSHNNGLYVLILELNEKIFGQAIVPVHPIKTIETELAKAGIKKSNSKPNLYIKPIGIKDGKIKGELYCKTNLLKVFTISL